MLPLPTDYIASVCEIKTLENELVATGTVRKITEEYIEISDKTGMMPVAPYGTQVKMNVYNYKHGFRVLAGKVYTSSIRAIRIMEVVSLLDYERRHFFRVEVGLSTQIVILSRKQKTSNKEDGEVAKDQQNLKEKKVEIPVSIRNLSLGGALFSTPEILETGDLISMRLKFDTGVFHYKGVVRRADSPDSSRPLFGCEFTENSRAALNALCAYIFQCQRQQIYKKRTEYQQL